MLFKTADIGIQYASLHPALRRALAETESVIIGWGLAPITITDAVRTKTENTAIYTAVNIGKGMHPRDAALKAQAQWSWHVCSCGADFRSSGKHYTDEEWKRILAWLKNHFGDSMWEALLHDVGLGFHGHLAFRDWDWRRKWETQTKGGTV